MRGRAESEAAPTPTPARPVTSGQVGGFEPRPEKPSLDPRSAGRATIAGTVRDARGQPVAGAQVCASARSHQLAASETRRPRCVTSARDGHYRIEGLFAVRHEVTASAPGFVPGIYSRGEGSERREAIDLRPAMEALAIDIALEDGGVELRGTVKDLSGGPIEGALVSGERGFATTSADGSFSLWVRPGQRWVRARADGYALGFDDGIAPGHAYEVFLTPEAVLVGKVVEATSGAPIEGARVTAMEGEWGTVDAQTFTDANGRFRLDGLEPGAYKARAETDETFGMAAEQAILGLGETSSEVVIAAHPAFFAAGRIVRDDGAGCDRGSLGLRHATEDRGGIGETESDGSVRVRGLSLGEYTVTVKCEGFVPPAQVEAVTIDGRSVSDRTWTVTTGQAIGGVVVDDAGRPVPRIEVLVSATTEPGAAPAAQTTSGTGQSDAQGKFAVAGLLPGRYEVTVMASEAPRSTPATPTSVTLPKGQDVAELRIELPATGEVRGTIRDSQGRPVGGAEVLLSDGVDTQHTTAGDGGEFVFAHVAAGEYRVVPRIKGMAAAGPGESDDAPKGATVTVRSGKTETVTLVVAGASGKITGVVRDESGAPVTDAFVEATRESNSAAGPPGAGQRGLSFLQKPILTDVDGRFTLEQLPAGTHALRAYRKGGGEANREHVALGDDVVLTIAPTARMSGSVGVRGGGAMSDEFTVRLVDASSGYERFDTFYRTGGAWSLSELPAGTYTVSVNAGAGSAEVQAAVSAGKDTTGVRVELTPKVTVRGSVVDLEGRPVADMEVTVGGRDAGPFGPPGGAMGLTDETGRFEVEGAPTGAVMVSLSPRNWGDSEFRSVNVPAVVASDRRVVELAPIRVTRTRTKAGEAAGDLGYKLAEAEAGADPLARRLVLAVVQPGGPAAAAGLQVGDEITSVDGQDVTGANAYLHRGLTQVPAGTAVTLGLARGASVQVTAGKRK
ncbi:carboxypeptidase regulatory-like domain-containing protein [Nannocystis sp. SCPEA4]|uniref:carboxypeptidase regulatory-like domain-containing protein n=1 Tax=Nannocystis sp. SCPEA4 TaxID=2996787 RepID=UPI00226E3843|nr:carboxypeptidase regulatory-like domain-containing protein [Nannocystis sp. SCPEA4]MCY1057147.1 carboxypeptidase regulatory-like domain-containing protein [Nannocystis sp. SCPEA4]